MEDYKGRSRLSARLALQSISRFEASSGGPRPFTVGFPIGAHSISDGTRFCSATSSVLYLPATISKELHRCVLFTCHSGIIENF